MSQEPKIEEKDLTSNLISDEVEEGQTRRDFVVMTATGAACVGAFAAIMPLLKSLSPSADVLAVGATEVDISKIKEGESITVMWRGYPVFIRHRTAEEIKSAQDVKISDLKDPEADEKRVTKGKEQWLVVLGSCTHLGCIPLAKKGEFGGWLCPCHGSEYDTSARVRKGPAPLNLPVPQYVFINDNKIKIG